MILRFLLACLVLAQTIAAFSAEPEPLSIDALAKLSESTGTSFTKEFDRTPLDGIKRSVVSFEADGLKQYSLVLEPDSEPPTEGWPIILATHGFHPDPPMNGRVADGSSDRPGDYYRGIPEYFARSGFLVLWPDLRGHNISQGVDYTGNPLSPLWYARDVMSAFSNLGSLEHGNTNEVFLWGHSMGGGISLRVALALGERVRAVSLWSPGFTAIEDSRIAQHASPMNHLEQLNAPLLIQHSSEDASTPVSRSGQLAEMLQIMGKWYQFERFDSNHHLFQGALFHRALTNDVQLFRENMVKNTPKQ